MGSTLNNRTIVVPSPVESRCYTIKVLLENGWNSKRMITEGDAAIPLETTRHAFRNQEKTKQRSTTGLGTTIARLFKVLPTL